MAIIPLSPDYHAHSPGILSLRASPGVSTGHPASLFIRSVPTPSKVSPAIWHRGVGQDPTVHQVLVYGDRHTGLSGQYGAISLIQRTSGCRIGEVLNLSTDDIILPDLIILKALKGSRPRCHRLPELSPQFASLMSDICHPLFSVSYSQVYRQYKASGIVYYTGSGSKNRVTHSYRWAFIKSVHRASKSINTTRDVVGHKSKRSTQNYLQKGPTNG